MIQTRTSFIQNPISQTFFPQNDSQFNKKEQNYDDPNLYQEEDDEEYYYPEGDDEEYSQDSYPGGEDSSDDEEEETSSEEDYPLVYYHLPTKIVDSKEEQIKLQERNQKIQEKKQQIKDQQQNQPLKLRHQNPKDHLVSLKKITRLSRPLYPVKLTCYIPNLNLLLVLLQNEITVNVYSTTTFNLIAIKKSQKRILSLNYSQHLKKVLVGGSDSLLQIWNPKTFEVEAESLDKGHTSYNLEYIPKANVIVSKAASQIRIYTTGLRYLTNISMPGCFGEWYTPRADFFALSKNLLLVICYYSKQKVPILMNLKTLQKVEFSKKIFIPLTSSVVMTEKNPQNVFTCLGIPSSAPTFISEWSSYKLLQFTIDKKTQELSIIRSNPDSASWFSKLNCFENSKYFLAQRWEKNNSQTFLLSVSKDQVNVMHVIPNMPILLSNITNYKMLNDGSSIVEINDRGFISVRGLSRRQWVSITNK